MKHVFCLMVLFCMCLGCKPKVSPPDAISPAVETPSDLLVSETNDVKPYFVASGTEPFWSLEISDAAIKFRTPVDSIFTPHTIPSLAQDSNVKRYDLETESSKITIQISQTECTNMMSGQVSPYTVTVAYKPIIHADFNKVTGCGEYKTDYRLHDIWVLESLNGKPAEIQNFNKDLPLLEIYANTNTFSGYAGCNQMNGRLFYEKGLLRFTQVSRTKIACEPINKEDEFVKALQSSTNYRIKNNRLTLLNPTGVLLVLKKID